MIISNILIVIMIQIRKYKSVPSLLAGNGAAVLELGLELLALAMATLVKGQWCADVVCHVYE